ncbi:MAG: AIPR family protein [Bacteroidota bacterium]|nr:AIPR family protein [Bacteroidota bacterium]
MAENTDNIELKKFYVNLQQDIRTDQLSDEEGGTLEQLFTQYAGNFLSGSGEVENIRVAYDEKILKTGVQHKINAYALSDNYETLDLIITVYNGTDEVSVVSKAEIDKASKRVSNFFKNAVYKDYVNEIEESSEIFQLAASLAEYKDIKDSLVRVNLLILTDGLYMGEPPVSHSISGYPVFFKVVDINYLYNISEKSHIPIEIDFKSDGFKIPCIKSPSVNEEYQSYLAIIPGDALVNIYERFGSRLLEQNVRSFLQFTGKVNNGIRQTILNEPHMFLAFNNGIAATADSLELENSEDGLGVYINSVKDLQIVNGGQTTASIYYTWKKDKRNVSNVFVQVKLSVVKNKENFSSIVSRISEYANTQNKVSVSDLSSNRPFHIEMEKLSRNIWAPPAEGYSVQTRWFYERARGQYKNARKKEEYSKSKVKAFDLKNPKNQMFTKEDLAKYINSYEEVTDAKKIIIGPHFVVKGNQKNYVQFMNHNLPGKIDSVYFEDLIAKAILFRAAEKKYGVKPNSIGDMRYVTVPYTIAYLNYKIKSKLDLYKIWKAQNISENLKVLLFDLMIEVENFIKNNAPRSLYGEWAKKEECWLELKKQEFNINYELIKTDLETASSNISRRRINIEDNAHLQIAEDEQKIKSIPSKIWQAIEEWGKTTEMLSVQQQNLAWNLSVKVKSFSKLTDYERISGCKILDIVIENASDLLEDVDEINESINTPSQNTTPPEITLDVIKKMVDWDRKNKRLKPHHFRLMFDIVNGKEELTEQNKKYCLMNYNFISKYGFKI